MNIDKLEQDIVLETLGNGKPVLGGSGRDYTGVPFSEVPPRSACDMMKWCHDNSGFRFKPYFELDYLEPRVGMRVYDGDGKVVKHIKRTATGGDNGDQTAQISTDMYKLIG